MLKKLKDKGALFIEYALILAFVIVAGMLFISSDSSSSIATIISKANSMLAGEANAGQSSKYGNYGIKPNNTWLIKNGVVAVYDGSSSGINDADRQWLSRVTASDKIPLDGGEGTYKLYFDFQAMSDYLNDLEGVSVAADALKAYYSSGANANIGIWGIKDEDNTLVSSVFRSSKDGKDAGSFGTAGDSGRISTQWLADGSVDYYTLNTTGQGNVYLAYNLYSMNSTAADSTSQAYNRALVNAGLKVEKLN